MGKCIICGEETKDFRCLVKKVGDKLYDDFQCERCTIEKVEKERAEYDKQVNEILLPYLKEHKFRYRVISNQNGEDIIEEFPLHFTKNKHYAEIIRERMLSQGYYENAIDFHWEVYKGVEVGLVDYLCYAMPDDTTGDSWVSYFIELVSESGEKLERVKM